MINYKSQLKLICFFSTALFFFSLFTSCEKEPDELGSNILPGDENFQLKSDSTYEISAKTIKVDAIGSYFPDSAFKIFPKNILGDYTDTTFGTSQAALLINFFPDSLTHKLGTNPRADSIVFCMKLDSIYGDKNSDFEIRIFDLNKKIKYDTSYNSNVNEAEYKGELLASRITKFTDSVVVKIESPTFINKLLQSPVYETKTNENLKNFQEYFKGFYIEIKQVSYPGLFVYLDPWKHSGLADKLETKLSMFYKNSTDTSRINYFIDTRVGKFSNNYTGTTVEKAINNSDLGKKVTFVQGMAGVRTRVHIDGLEKWTNEGPASINKAELVIPVQSVETSGIQALTYPKRLSIMAVNKNDSLFSMEYGAGQSFLGGAYNEQLKAYTFNLSKHIQYLVNSKLQGKIVEVPDFIIVADGYFRGQTHNFNKVALDFSQGKGAKLNIVYSKQ